MLYSTKGPSIIIKKTKRGDAFILEGNITRRERGTRIGAGARGSVRHLECWSLQTEQSCIRTTVMRCGIGTHIIPIVVRDVLGNVQRRGTNGCFVALRRGVPWADVDTILAFASFHVVLSVTCTRVLIRGNACPTRCVCP